MHLVVLMSAGVKWILILLAVLIVCGAVSFLLVKEKQRKDRAAQRAAERKAIRDKVLEEARSGNAQAFENLSVKRRLADKPVLSSEDSMRLAKLEKLENDLNALQSMVSTDSRRFSTTELNIAEASGEVTASADADEMSVGIAALANGDSSVDFRHLATQLQEAEKQEEAMEAIQAPEETKEAPKEEVQPFREDTPAGPAPAIAAGLSVMTATLTEVDAEEIPEIKPFTDTEEDYEELVFKPMRELPSEEEESDYKPYKDEDEALAEEYEKQAILTGSHIGVPLPEAETIPAEAEVTIQEVVDPEEAPAEEEAEAPVPASVEETIAEPTVEAPVAQLKAEAPAVKEPAPEEAVPAPAFELQQENEDYSESQEFEDNTFAHLEAAPAKMYDTMGFTMSLEMQKLSDEERRAAREARMAEKAKYAAALAGEEDFPEEEPEEEDYDDDEDFDLEDEEGISVGRVILWILAAILSLVCVGAILYLLFGQSLNLSFLGASAKGALWVKPLLIKLIR